jgi:hypothetical protein
MWVERTRRERLVLMLTGKSKHYFMNRESSIWFPEPLLVDDTYQDRAEHTLDWLARSTVPRAKACRRFLNEHIAKLPVLNQSNIVHDLRAKWHSTFVELIVARILQELGASIVIETANPDGRRPDFRAQFPDASVTVEAKAPIFDAATGDELKNRVPLLNYIESKVPAGWRVCVYQLPSIGPADSRKKFERAVQQMLNVPPPDEDDTDRELIAEFAAGIIHLHLFPTNLNNKRLGWEAPISLVDNSRERIRLAVKRKRRQVRNSRTPVLLAIQASGICSDFEDFDLALFGAGYDRYDEHRRLVETGFMPNGIFSNKSDKAPTFAGVLAFLTVGFNACVGPVLYRHPRFSETLPDALLQLEQRSYNESINRIQIEPSKIPDLIERLNLVSV